MEKYLWLPLTLVLAAFPLGQLTRISLFSPAINFNALDIASLFSIPFGIAIVVSRKRSLQMPFIKPFLVFILVLHLSLFVNIFRLTGLQIFISYLYILRLISSMSIFLCAFAIPLGKRQLLSRSLLGVALISAVGGIIQYIILPDLRPLAVQHWDPHLYRSVGTFLDPGFLGIIMLLGLILLLFSNIRSSVVKAAAFSLLYTCMSLTYSRASFLAFATAVIHTSAILRSFKILIFGTSLLGITMLVLPKTESVGTQLKRSDSITARIENWQNSLQIWKKYLLTGSGYNAYRFTQIQEGLAREEDLLYSHSAGGADSSLLLTGATSGILGVVVLLVFVVRVTNREVKRKFPALAVSIAAVLIHSLFLNSLYYPWVMVWLAILIGEYSRVKGNI